MLYELYNVLESMFVCFLSGHCSSLSFILLFVLSWEGSMILSLSMLLLFQFFYFMPRYNSPFFIEIKFKNNQALTDNLIDLPFIWFLENLKGNAGKESREDKQKQNKVKENKKIYIFKVNKLFLFVSSNSSHLILLILIVFDFLFCI